MRHHTIVKRNHLVRHFIVASLFTLASLPALAQQTAPTPEEARTAASQEALTETFMREVQLRATVITLRTKITQLEAELARLRPPTPEPPK